MAIENHTSLSDIATGLEERISWGRGVLQVLAGDPALENCIGSAAAAVDSHLADAGELIGLLYRWKEENGESSEPEERHVMSESAIERIGNEINGLAKTMDMVVNLEGMDPVSSVCEQVRVSLERLNGDIANL